MRRLYLIIIYMCLTLVVGRVHAQYYSVNYDKQIVAAMAAAFGAELWQRAIITSRWAKS